MGVCVLSLQIIMWNSAGSEENRPELHMFDWLLEEDGAFRSIRENPYLSTESTSEFNGTFTF